MFENVSASKCALSFFSGWYSYPRMPFGFGSAMWLMPSNWKRNVSAVQS